jgi:hypothetical protein
MPKIVILSESNYGGAKFLNFSMDGKYYVVLPKLGEDQSWLDEFKKLLQFSNKYGLNPFATPLKSDAKKADKYKNMRMYDRIKYSWNDDTSIKAGKRKGLRNFVDVVPKEKLKEFMDKRQSIDSEQMKLKLSNIVNKLASKNLSETAERLSVIIEKIN